VPCAFAQAVPKSIPFGTDNKLIKERPQSVPKMLAIAFGAFYASRTYFGTSIDTASTWYHKSWYSSNQAVAGALWTPP
jgi:hypothetical protein